jgi:group II intron reverse transcriptase/maturase
MFSVCVESRIDCFARESRIKSEGTWKALSIQGVERRSGTMQTTAEPTMMQKVLSPSNLLSAAHHVYRNKGAPGIDEMTVDELLPYLRVHQNELVGQIGVGSYKPLPVLRVEIPKPDGGIRLLGIPTVQDRMIQQAIAQVLVPIFEPVFSDHSFGFRPGRSAQDAVREAKGYFDEGYAHVVDIDLAKYFDTICHDKLMSMLRETVDDDVCRLIRKYLKSGVMIGGLYSPTKEGAPQGGPLSPLLSNIYLTEFDKSLEEKGLKFVRYADDCNVYLRSRRAAERVMQSSTRFLEGVLKLKVNQAKSKVGSPTKLKFLGFSLWKIGERSGVRIHEKSLKRFKDTVRDITTRNRGRSVEYVFEELKRYTVGWMGYYKLASLTGKLKEIDGWIRARIRQYIWKQWKRVRTRFRNLMRLGIWREQAWMWANTRKGYWRTAHSPILSKTLTNQYLEELGLINLSKLFKRLTKPSPACR